MISVSTTPGLLKLLGDVNNEFNNRKELHTVRDNKYRRRTKFSFEMVFFQKGPFFWEMPQLFKLLLH